MSKAILLLLLLSLSPGSRPCDNVAQPESSTLEGQLARSPLNKVALKSREAAVRVEEAWGSGYGSGAYFKHGKLHFVITAHHVVSSGGPILVASPTGETVLGMVVFRSPSADIAVIAISGMKTRKPMPFKPLKKLVQPGEEVTYSGYPGHHLLTQTFNGAVTGYEVRHGKYVLVNSYIWFGSSGSCLFDKRGNLVGIISAIEVQSFVTRQALPGLAWVKSITEVDTDKILLSVEQGGPKR
jgi:S1-C subfamily serine protease